MMISAFTFRWKKFLKGKKFSSSENSQKMVCQLNTFSGLCRPKGKFQKSSPTDSSPEPTSMYEVLNYHRPDTRLNSTAKQGLGNSGQTIWTFHWLI